MAELHSAPFRSHVIILGAMFVVLAATSAFAVGNFLDLDGVNDTVKVLHDPVLDPNPGTGDMTVEAWFKTNAGAPSTIVDIVGMTSTSPGGPHYSLRVHPDGRVSFVVRDEPSD